MAHTLQDIVDLARESLNDDDGDRWPDETLLLFAQDGFGELMRLRPDLYVGQYSTFDQTALELVTASPLDNQYSRLVADYVVARAESEDAEEMVDGRAAAFMKLMESRL